MKTHDIIESEKDNTDRIQLHHEGMFLRAYEASALLLIRHGVELAPVKKYIRKEDFFLVTVGFPAGQMESRLKGLESLSEDAVHPVFRSTQPVTVQQLQEWKDTLPAREGKPHAAPAGHDVTVTAMESARDRILRFDLATSTPMDAMNLVASLKKELL